MKQLFTFLAAICFFSTAQAQTPITIAAARALGAGATVTVSGIVTNGPELGVIRYFQDATGGLSGYSTNQSLPPNNTAFTSLMPGDSIIITGTLKSYNNLLEGREHRPRDPQAITVFKSLGAGIEDLAIASLLYDRGHL